MSLLEKMRGDRMGWYKVSALTAGTEIAVPSEDGGILWDEIVSISPVGREQVWDIEVEGTHNFVAGHYVNSRANTALTFEQEEIITLQRQLAFGSWLLDNDTYESYGQRAGTSLRTIARLARSNFLNKGDVQALFEISQGGALRHNESASSSGILDSAQYSGGAEQRIEGLSSLPDDSSRLVQRNAHDTDADDRTRTDRFERYCDSPDTIAFTDEATARSFHNTAKAILQKLTANSQLPEDNQIVFGGIFAHNTAFVVNQGAPANSLYIPPNGNVGVGSTTPWGLLSINPTAAIGSAPQFVIGSSTATNFIVTNGGNVGIGTASPTQVLHVTGASTPRFQIDQAGAAAVQILSDGINGYVQTLSTNDLYFRTNNVNTGAMVLKYGGNVGIGTTAPGQLLSLFKAGTTAATSPQILFTASSTAAGLPAYTNNWAIGTDLADGGKFKISSSTVIGTNDRFVIDGNGNVGIGTTSPAATLAIQNAYGTRAANLFTIASSTSSDGSTSTNFLTMSNAGNLGIGTSSPYARLSIVDTTAGLHDVFAIASSTTLGNIFSVDSYGATHGDGAYTSPAADYAEYFKTESADLQSGEVVCIDPLNNNAVMRCARGADNNVMGIVSTKPSVIGNSTKAVAADPTHYAVIGMMGQVEAYVSAENGAINVGDSLTSASTTPGYAMRANGGDSTVGIALEPLSTASSTGKIKVLISRRNKSLAVEEVESLVVDRIANMKIEDRVNQMVAQAVNAVMQSNFAVSGSVFATGFETANAPVTPFVWESLTFPTSTTTAEIPAAVLTAAGGVDLYKLATYNLSGVMALASSTSALAVRVTSLEDRVAKLESGAISTASNSPISIGTTSLASALNAFGAYISKGIAQFGTLVADQFVAATNSAGTSSAGTVTILAGNTVAQVNNAYVLPTTKIFVTFTASTTGSWYISDKQKGSFKVVLSQAPATDTSFDYFLVQTEGQIATSTPSANLEAELPLGSSASKLDANAPVITMLGDSTVHLSIGSVFVEPGVSAVDAVDGGVVVDTYINGVKEQISTVTIDTSSAQTYTITYKATNSVGSVATATRTVIVDAPSGSTSLTGGTASSTTTTASSTPASGDTTPPVVTLNGAAAMNVDQNTTFTDPGATALDAVDGDLTAKIVETGAVDTATAGLYTLTYSATDAAGNTGSASRVVTVVATTTATASSTPQQ